MVCSTHNTNARIRYQNHVSVCLSVSQVDSQIAPCVIVMLIKTLFPGGSSVRNINAKVSNKSMGCDDSQLRRYAPTRIENQLHSTLMMLNRYLLITVTCGWNRDLSFLSLYIRSAGLSFSTLLCIYQLWLNGLYYYFTPLKHYPSP